MNRSGFNASRHNHVNSPGHRTSEPGGRCSALRASLTETTCGSMLELWPMSIADALRPWARLRANDDFVTLVIGTGVSGSAAGAAVLDDESLRRLVRRSSPHELLAVLIDGPVEHRDVDAILSAIRAGRSALEMEIRAVAAMRVMGDGSIVLQTRVHRSADIFVAEALRNYLADLRRRPATEVSAPEIGLIDALFARSGRIDVRPIETEIYSTSIDIGISTASNGEIKPANESLIYDICSNTWHGE